MLDNRGMKLRGWSRRHSDGTWHERAKSSSRGSEDSLSLSLSLTVEIEAVSSGMVLLTLRGRRARYAARPPWNPPSLILFR